MNSGRDNVLKTHFIVSELILLFLLFYTALYTRLISITVISLYLYTMYQCSVYIAVNTIPKMYDVSPCT